MFNTTKFGLVILHTREDYDISFKVEERGQDPERKESESPAGMTLNSTTASFNTRIFSTS